MNRTCYHLSLNLPAWELEGRACYRRPVHIVSHPKPRYSKLSCRTSYLGFNFATSTLTISRCLLGGRRGLQVEVAVHRRVSVKYVEFQTGLNKSLPLRLPLLLPLLRPLALSTTLCSKTKLDKTSETLRRRSRTVDPVVKERNNNKTGNSKPKTKRPPPLDEPMLACAQSTNPPASIASADVQSGTGKPWPRGPNKPRRVLKLPRVPDGVEEVGDGVVDPGGELLLDATLLRGLVYREDVVDEAPRGCRRKWSAGVFAEAWGDGRECGTYCAWRRWYSTPLAGGTPSCFATGSP